MADHPVATSAEQAPHKAGRVVVIYVERTHLSLPAHRALPALRVEHGLVACDGHAILADQVPLALLQRDLFVPLAW